MGDKEKVNILMVDNQASKLGEPLSEMLNLPPNEDRYSVITTEDPRQALEVLPDIDLAIIGLDLSKEYSPRLYEDFLPEIKENVGYKLLAYLKKEYPHIKVVILASYAACEGVPSDEKARALQRGALAFIAKPFSSNELTAEIKRILVPRG